MRLKSILLFATLIAVVNTNASAWHNVKHPTDGETVIYGSYANGCFSGGVNIPIKGEGYEQVRPSRNRNYGDHSLYEFVQKLGAYSKSQHKTVILGDLSQPRGGMMNTGHTSHQVGLDVDIWFDDIGVQGLSEYEVEKLVTPSLVDAKKGQVNQYWRPYYRDLLYQSAQNPTTERIFVNPVIKDYLCRTEKNRDWLYKIRPWFGHDEHFHVRLICPKNQKYCVPQAPIAKASGCDDVLQSWVVDQQEVALGIKKPHANKMAPSKKRKVMPSMCREVLQRK